MSKRQTSVQRATPEQNEIDYDRFAEYEDGDATVICDRKDPRAWIKSDVVTDLEQ